MAAPLSPAAHTQCSKCGCHSTACSDALPPRPVPTQAASQRAVYPQEAARLPLTEARARSAPGQGRRQSNRACGRVCARTGARCQGRAPRLCAARVGQHYAAAAASDRDVRGGVQWRPAEAVPAPKDTTLDEQLLHPSGGGEEETPHEAAICEIRVVPGRSGNKASAQLQGPDCKEPLAWTGVERGLPQQDVHCVGVVPAESVPGRRVRANARRVVPNVKMVGVHGCKADRGVGRGLRRQGHG